MKEILILNFSVAALFLLYCFFYKLRARFAKKELATSGISWKADGAIHVEAMAESMEYYIRMAFFSSNGGSIPIIVHIRANDGKKQELICMAEKMARRYPNLSVRLSE